MASKNQTLMDCTAEVRNAMREARLQLLAGEPVDPELFVVMRGSLEEFITLVTEVRA